MRLLNCLLTANRCYKTGATIKPKGVMVHSTGANNPNLRRYVQPVSTTPGRTGPGCWPGWAPTPTATTGTGRG